jgi:putative (di)nucleoside polyphosphate hydrolase
MDEGGIGSPNRPATASLGTARRPEVNQLLWRHGGKLMSEDIQFFRANVGIVLTDGKGKVLAFERVDIPGAWQFPQGGLDQGEEPSEAAIRELREETGLSRERVRPLAEHPDWLTYELPPEARSEKTGRGQAQKWLLFQFDGDVSEIDLDASDEKEFADVRWTTFESLLPIVPDFRKPIYERVMAVFDPLTLS